MEQKLNFPDDYINKVINADCLLAMKGIPDKSIDMVLTDPPYGIKRDEGFEGFEIRGCG
jgi:DNA modification methylase